MPFVQDLTMWKSPARPVLFNHVSSAAKGTVSSKENSAFLEQEEEAEPQCLLSSSAVNGKSLAGIPGCLTLRSKQPSSHLVPETSTCAFS